MIVGTGKTLIGVKIAYWFVERNKSCQSGARKQVLFCGPSNNSVDVAAGMALLNILLKILSVSLIWLSKLCLHFCWPPSVLEVSD